MFSFFLNKKKIPPLTACFLVFLVFYFRRYEHAVQLIKAGKAYVDDSPAEVLKDQRSEKKPSPCRDRPVADSLRLFEQDMKNATPVGINCCLRAKMFYDHDNGALRDPVLYRCKPEEHVRLVEN